MNIRGIRVHSRVNANNDGIDIDCCQRVCISDCDISSGDDAIVLKSTAGRITKDVTITNCVLSTACNALKPGTESSGGFQNIVMNNCTIYDTRLAGIALEMVDGGTLDRVIVSGFTMNNVGAPIFMRLGDRGRPFIEGGSKFPIGTFRNVIVSNVQATGCGKTGCAIAGLPDHPIEDLTLDNIHLRFAGGEKKVGRAIPENPDKYPEYGMFGTLPAFGFYFRHVRGLRIRDVELTTDKPDGRPPTIMDDTLLKTP